MAIIDSTLQIFAKDQNETPNKFGSTHSNSNGHSDSSSALDYSDTISKLMRRKQNYQQQQH
jgi:hypothetical protein